MNDDDGDDDDYYFIVILSISTHLKTMVMTREGIPEEEKIST